MTEAEPARTAWDYKNPDRRCDYPFSPCGAGYCWSYAHHVDGTLKRPLLDGCSKCEMFRPWRAWTTPRHWWRWLSSAWASGEYVSEVLHRPWLCRIRRPWLRLNHWRKEREAARDARKRTA